MTQLLLVEDDPSIVRHLSEFLQEQGFAVQTVPGQAEALAALRANTFDLILLDISLQNGNGFSACVAIKEQFDLPVIFLTASADEYSVITGLDLGADDYITKPFLPLELLARVKAQLRRYKRYNAAEAEADDVIVVSGLVLNSRTHECTLNERPLALTPTEFSLLRILCRQRGNVVSSEELLHQLWGEEYYSKSNNTVTVHIRHLREKMGDSFENPKYIKTVWGVGYKIEG